MAHTVRLIRTATLPDRYRVARYQRAPEMGPHVLFFSGGSALAPLSREIIKYTHNSIHLITPFDSGGSSAKLRKAFNMLAVGDLRNRLMALADQSVTGNPAIVKLFAYRFPGSESQEALIEKLESMVSGRHPMVADIIDPMRKIIRNHLRFFCDHMPPDFDLKGASIGNLVLTGGYLNNSRHIDPVVFTFSKLAEVRGTVRPVVNKDLQLAARLADGDTIVGQHLLTGREVSPISSRVEELYLTRGEDGRPAHTDIRQKMRRLIAKAELICYPMGSFYSSLIANLLPRGVGRAVAANGCPKVYVPNTAADSEQLGMSVADGVRVLLDCLGRDCEPQTPSGDLLNLVLVDSSQGQYPGGLDIRAIERLGVQVVDTSLVSESSSPYIDENKLTGVLLSLV